ncbi:MAG: tape measure protein, partial [Oscillospiraceae bacterium]|nr:tape measure protein [Oscillospiraceae bacterium]
MAKPVRIEILLEDNATPRLRVIEDELDEVREGTERVSEGMDGIGKSADKAADMVKKIAAAFAAKELVGKIAEVRGEFQQLEIAFETMLGNKEASDALMAQLIQTAATTPFGMSDVANSAKQLLAYGVEAGKVNETLIRLGDIASGLSIPIGELAYLYGTTMVQGRMYTQDLNQFLGRGIPLMEELATQFGVTKAEVKGLVEEGKVGFPEVEKAIVSLTSEGSMFGGLMEKQSKTISGQISNLEDAVEQMFNNIGKAQEGNISSAIEMASALVENYETVGEVLSPLVGAVGGYTAALVVYKTAANLAAAAQGLLNKTMLNNPFVATMTIVGGVSAALYTLASRLDSAAEAESRMAKVEEEMQKQCVSERLEVDRLFGELEKAKKGTDEYRAAKERVLEQYGAYLKGMEKEMETADGLKKAHEEVARAVLAAARARGMAAAQAKEEEAYAERYTSSASKLYEGLSEYKGADAAKRYIEKIREEIDKTGKVSEKTRKEISGIYSEHLHWTSPTGLIKDMEDAARDLA